MAGDSNVLQNGSCNIMFPHSETTTQSPLATNIKKGSAQHLSALIDLCELIERHKKFILARTEPRETDESFRTDVIASQGDARQFERPRLRVSLR